MTQDEIIEMAKEANVIHPEQVYVILEAFANLVAEKATEEANARANASWTLMCEKMVAHEREAIALEFKKRHEAVKHLNNYWLHAANYVQARGQQ